MSAATAPATDSHENEDRHPEVDGNPEEEDDEEEDEEEEEDAGERLQTATKTLSMAVKRDCTKRNLNTLWRCLDAWHSASEYELRMASSGIRVSRTLLLSRLFPGLLSQCGGK